MEVPEPLYEDITLPQIATATDTTVPTEPNAAYAGRKETTNHVTVHNIATKINEAYQEATMPIESNNASCAVRRMTINHATTHEIVTEENDAYQLTMLFEQNEAYAMVLPEK